MQSYIHSFILLFWKEKKYASSKKYLFGDKMISTHSMLLNISVVTIQIKLCKQSNFTFTLVLLNYLFLFLIHLKLKFLQLQMTKNISIHEKLMFPKLNVSITRVSTKTHFLKSQYYCILFWKTVVAA